MRIKGFFCAIIIGLPLYMIFSCSSTPTHIHETQSTGTMVSEQAAAPIQVGAARLNSYVALLKNKKSSKKTTNSVLKVKN